MVFKATEKNPAVVLSKVMCRELLDNAALEKNTFILLVFYLRTYLRTKNISHVENVLKRIVLVKGKGIQT